MRLLIFIFIFPLVLQAQRKINCTDIANRKQGLWINRENGVTTDVTNYLNDTFHGFKISFNDSGEILTYTLYERGRVNNKVDSLYIVSGKPFFEPDTTFTGRRFYTGGDDYWVLKEGYFHGVQVIHKRQTKKYRNLYREHINFKGSGLYIILFNEQNIPISYIDLITENNLEHSIDSIGISGNRISFKQVNKTSEIGTVPNFYSRTLNFRGTYINELFYKYSSDTLIFDLRNDSDLVWEARARFYDGKMNYYCMTQFIYNSKFINDTLFPNEEKYYYVKIKDLKRRKIKVVVLINDWGTTISNVK